MENNKVTVLGVSFDRVTLEEAYQKFKSLLKTGGFHYIVTPNPEIVMKAQKDSRYRNVLAGAALTLPDGIGIVIGTKFRKNKITQRVPGFEFTSEILRHAVSEGYRIFLIGGKPGVALDAKSNLEKAYPGIQVVGAEHGYFQKEEEPEMVKAILDSGANVILSAMGAPRQEYFLFDHKEEFQDAIGIGVGGTLDVLAGRVERAPEFYQKIGMEWLYRMVKEPVRLKRAGALPLFLLKAFTERSKE